MTNSQSGQIPDRTALILYGSQTGNSQDVAEDLGRLAQRLRFATRVCEMDQVKPDILLKVTFVIFVVGTTGQGEFPRNAQVLWRSLLKKRLPPDCLSRLNFTTFGLGDSSYPKFNWAIRKLHKRIEQLGGKEIYPRGEGDEQHDEGIDGTFLSWSADLRRRLLSSYPLPPGITEIPADVLLPPPYTLAIRDEPTRPVSASAALKQKHIVLPSRGALNSVNTNVNNPSLQQNISVVNTSVLNASTTNNSKLFNNLTKMRPSLEVETDAQPDTRSQLKGEAHDHDPAHDDTQAALPPDIIPVNNVFVVKLLDNVRVTPESHWQDVRLLTFEIPVGKDYLAGDTITIYPKNFPQDVQTLIDLQGWNSVADIPLVFKAEAPHYFSAQNLAMPPAWPGFHPLERSSLRELLTHNLDFTAIPKRKFFNDLAHHTDDPTHKERLLDFTNPALSDEFFDYTTRPRRSILEVLQDFPSVKLPWQWAATIFPPIRGRQFSICSGGALQEHTTEGETVKLQILVAIVKYKTVIKKVRQGLCSRYIASLPAGTVMGITKEPNDTFFRAMQATYGRPVIMVGPGTGVAPCRSLIWQRASEVINFPNRKAEMALFFGNRNREADFFFKDEWKDPSLAVKVFTAFSRDQREKIYVQDLIRKEGYLVNRLIQEEALIIVCGSSGKMPQQVRNAFIDAMEEYGGPWESREKVEEAFKGIEKDGLYIQETW